jgi:amino acid transporter
MAAESGAMRAGGPVHHIEAHDPHHAAEPDLLDKGLSHNSIGLLGSTVIGVACVAPVYALTATLGPTVTEVGFQMPAIFLAGFLPMLLVAFGYRELNRVAPDCGTTFTWGTKAFNPYVGWLGGWGLVLSTVIVLSNLAGVAVTFLYLFLADATGNQSLAALADNRLVNVLTCAAFVALATWISYRGMTTTKEVQYVLVSFQMLLLVGFVVFAFVKIANGTAPASNVSFSLDWLNPFSVASFAAFTAGISLSLFIFWGWDVCLTINEETSGSEKTPGRAALLTTVVILSSYLLVAIAAMWFAGIGETGVGLGNPNTADNVFAALAEPVMGGFGTLLFLAVLASSAASLQTTFLSPARTLLAMGTYKAVPSRFSRVHPRFQTPTFATLAAGVGTIVFYTVMTLVSENVLIDTIYALGMMISFYYAITAFSCVWYFRKELFSDARSIVFKFLIPLFGGILLAVVFLKTTYDTFDPDYGTGSSVFGIGSVFFLGFGLLVVGVVLMLWWRVKQPEFFRGEVLKRDTPSLVVED